MNWSIFFSGMMLWFHIRLNRALEAAQKCEERYRHGSSVTEMPGKVLAKIPFSESRIYEPAPKCCVIVAWNTLRSMSHCELELVVLLELICDQVL